MHTSMAVSKNFTCFPSTTQSSAHMQVRKISSEITVPLVVTGLQTPMARPDNIQQGNAITPPSSIPGQRKDWSHKPSNCHRFADTNGATQQHPARNNHCSTPKPKPAQQEVWGWHIYDRATNTNGATQQTSSKKTPFVNAHVNTRPEGGLQRKCNSMLRKERTPLLYLLLKPLLKPLSCQSLMW